MSNADFVFDYAPLYDRLANDKVLTRPSPARNHISCTSRDRIRKVLLDVHGPYCWLCGRKIRGQKPTLDHIVPRSLGGRNAIANLRLAHASCNQRRGSGPIPELLLTEVHHAAIAAGTQSAETNEDLAQSEGCQSGAEGNRTTSGHLLHKRSD